jgi:hypothetical protein
VRPSTASSSTAPQRTASRCWRTRSRPLTSELCSDQASVTPHGALTSRKAAALLTLIPFEAFQVDRWRVPPLVCLALTTLAWRTRFDSKEPALQGIDPVDPGFHSRRSETSLHGVLHLVLTTSAAAPPKRCCRGPLDEPTLEPRRTEHFFVQRQ